MYLRLPLSLVIDNARRLVLRHRVRSIKVSLGARRSGKKREGRDGRPVRTDANRAAKSERNRSIPAALSLVAAPRSDLPPPTTTTPPSPSPSTPFLRPRQAITANTGRLHSAA